MADQREMYAYRVAADQSESEEAESEEESREEEEVWRAAEEHGRRDEGHLTAQVIEDATNPIIDEWDEEVFEEGVKNDPPSSSSGEEVASPYITLPNIAPIQTTPNTDPTATALHRPSYTDLMPNIPPIQATPNTDPTCTTAPQSDSTCPDRSPEGQDVTEARNPHMDQDGRGGDTSNPHVSESPGAGEAPADPYIPPCTLRRGRKRGIQSGAVTVREEGDRTLSKKVKAPTHPASSQSTAPPHTTLKHTAGSQGWAEPRTSPKKVLDQDGLRGCEGDKTERIFRETRQEKEPIGPTFGNSGRG